MNQDGVPAFLPPSGRALPRTWAPSAVWADAMENLAETHAQRGLDLDEHSLLPETWDGEPTDHVWINDVLCQRTFGRAGAWVPNET